MAVIIDNDFWEEKKRRKDSQSVFREITNWAFGAILKDYKISC